MRAHALVIKELVSPINYVATEEQAEKIEEALTETFEEKTAKDYTAKSPKIEAMQVATGKTKKRKDKQQISARYGEKSVFG